MLPQDTIIATKDYLFVRDAIDAAFQEDMPLVTGVQFMHQAEGFRRIEFGHRQSMVRSSSAGLQGKNGQWSMSQIS